MRIVIIGSGGRLGGALARRLGTEHDVVPIGRAEMDLANPAEIRSVLGGLDYDKLLLPGALTLVDYCEDHRDEAFAVNADAPGLVSEISAAKGAQVIHFSTDFVFDGKQGRPCRESDRVNPISVYGASKARGEENVLSESSGNLVVRVSWLYGAGKPAFPEWIIGQAMKSEELSLPGEKVGSTTRAEDLCDHVLALMGLEDGDAASGIFHVANSGSCSWREWGQFCIDSALARGLPLKARHVTANRLEDVKAFAAPRPVDSRLDISKFTAHTGIKPRPWQAAMEDHFMQSKPFAVQPAVS